MAFKQTLKWVGWENALMEVRWYRFVEGAEFEFKWSVLKYWGLNGAIIKVKNKVIEEKKSAVPTDSSLLIAVPVRCCDQTSG